MREQLQNMWKKNPTYWALVILTAALCFGFTLTNPSMGVDDESFGRFFRGTDLLEQGRFFSHYMLYILDTYDFLPFWRDFFALILIICGATGITHAYQLFSGERFSVHAQTALVCVALAFPYMAHQWIFMMTTVEIGYLYVMTALCLLSMYQVFLGHRTVANCIGLVLLFLLTSILSEQGTTLLLTCGTASLALHVLYSPSPAGWKSLLAQYSIFLILLAVTMLTSQLLGRLVVWLNGLDYVGYVGSYILYDLQNLPYSVCKFLIAFPGQLWNRALQDKALLCYLFLCVVLLGSGIRSCIRRKSLMPILVMMATALAPLGLMLVTGNVTLDPRTLVNLGLATGLPAGLLLVEAGELHISLFRLKWVAVALVALLVVNFSRSMNRIFYTDELKYQRDKALMESVITDLRETDYELAKPVVFLGLPEGPEYVMDSPITTSIYVWDRVFSKEDELESGRIFRFFQAHGYPLQTVDNINPQQLYTQVSAMPSYPSDGYIKDCGQYVLVRLGQPGIEHFSQSRNDFLIQNNHKAEQPLGNLEYCTLQVESFAAGGWAVLDGVDSARIQVSVCLVSDYNQYVLRTERNKRSDVTAHFNNGINYDDSGFTVYPTNLRSLAVQPGTYQVMLWIHSLEYSSLMETDTIIICE